MLRKNEKRNAKGGIVGERHMPKGLPERLLKVFSKTGNEDFDELFHGQLKNGTTRCLLENVEDEAAQAHKFYDRLNRLDQWETEGTRMSAFSADIGPQKGKPGSKCFGCGRENCRPTHVTCPRRNMGANSEGKKAKAAFDAAKAVKRAPRESEKQGGEPPKIPDKGDKKGKIKWPPAPKGDDPKEQEDTIHKAR